MILRNILPQLFLFFLRCFSLFLQGQFLLYLLVATQTYEKKETSSLRLIDYSEINTKKRSAMVSK